MLPNNKTKSDEHNSRIAPQHCETLDVFHGEGACFRDVEADVKLRGRRRQQAIARATASSRNSQHGRQRDASRSSSTVSEHASCCCLEGFEGCRQRGRRCGRGAMSVAVTVNQ